MGPPAHEKRADALYRLPARVALIGEGLDCLHLPPDAALAVDDTTAARRPHACPEADFACPFYLRNSVRIMHIALSPVRFVLLIFSRVEHYSTSPAALTRAFLANPVPKRPQMGSKPAANRLNRPGKDANRPGKKGAKKGKKREPRGTRSSRGSQSTVPPIEVGRRRLSADDRPKSGLAIPLGGDLAAGGDLEDLVILGQLVDEVLHVGELPLAIQFDGFVRRLRHQARNAVVFVDEHVSWHLASGSLRLRRTSTRHDSYRYEGGGDLKVLSRIDFVLPVRQARRGRPPGQNKHTTDAWFIISCRLGLDKMPVRW